MNLCLSVSVFWLPTNHISNHPQCALFSFFAGKVKAPKYVLGLILEPINWLLDVAKGVSRYC